MNKFVLAALFGFATVQSQSLLEEILIENELTQLADIDAATEIAQDENAEKQFQNLQDLLKKTADDMESNVKFAREAVDNVVEPAKFKESYAKGQEMATEIEKRQFRKKQTFTKLQNDLKSYHTDLANAMKDIGLLATATNDNIGRLIKKIELRQKLEASAKLDVAKDLKIWTYLLKTQSSNMEYQSQEFQVIIKALNKVVTDVKKTEHDVARNIRKTKRYVKSLVRVFEKEMKRVKDQVGKHCGFKHGEHLDEHIAKHGEDKVDCYAYQTKMRDTIKDFQEHIDSDKDLLKTLESDNTYFEHYVNTKKLQADVEQAQELFKNTQELATQVAAGLKAFQDAFADKEINGVIGNDAQAKDYETKLLSELKDLVQKNKGVNDELVERKKDLEAAMQW